MMEVSQIFRKMGIEIKIESEELQIRYKTKENIEISQYKIQIKGNYYYTQVYQSQNKLNLDGYKQEIDLNTLKNREFKRIQLQEIYSGELKEKDQILLKSYKWMDGYNLEEIIDQQLKYMKQEQTQQEQKEQEQKVQVLAQTPFKFDEIQPIMNQILQLVQFLHQKQLIHRNLSLKSFMIQRFTHDVYLCGLGYIQFDPDPDPEQILNKTNFYQKFYILDNAPETIYQQSTGDFQSDIYMLGNLLFLLIFNNYPFIIKEQPLINHYRKMVQYQNYCYPQARLNPGLQIDHLKQLKNFFEQLLAYDPNKRVQIDKIINLNQDINEDEKEDNEFLLLEEIPKLESSQIQSSLNYMGIDKDKQLLFIQTIEFISLTDNHMNIRNQRNLIIEKLQQYCCFKQKIICNTNLQWLSLISNLGTRNSQTCNLIFEYYNQGNLNTFLQNIQYVEVKILKSIIKQLLDIVKFIYQKKISNLRLQLENFVIRQDQNTQLYNIVLSDPKLKDTQHESQKDNSKDNPKDMLKDNLKQDLKNIFIKLNKTFDFSQYLEDFDDFVQQCNNNEETDEKVQNQNYIKTSSQN